MVICPNCGKNTPHGKFCEHCGAQLITAQQPMYPQYSVPVTHVPLSFPESKSTERSFSYSGIFYIVLILDFLFSFLLGAVGVYGFSIEVQKRILDPFGFSLAIYLMVVFLINIVTDLILLTHKRKFPNSIDSKTCWIKCVFGFLGIVTVISGLYFLIISIKMRRAYTVMQK
jgi:hypothetical protein